jgi:hypothetical protein
LQVFTLAWKNVAKGRFGFRTQRGLLKIPKCRTELVITKRIFLKTEKMARNLLNSCSTKKIILVLIFFVFYQLLLIKK